MLARMIDTTRVQAITLDLDDTLWPVAPVIVHAENTLRDWLQQHLPRTAQLWQTPDLPREVRRAVVQRHPERRHDLSFLRREMIRDVMVQAGDAPEHADAAFEVFFAARQQVTLFEDSLGTLRALASRYPLLALSNGNANVRQIGLGDCFVASIAASDVGCAKPDPRIFQAAADAAGLAPEQILHVGDDAQLDAQAARETGMQAVWLNREGKPWPLETAPPPQIHTLATLVQWLLPR